MIRPPRSRLVRRRRSTTDGSGHREILGALVVRPDGCPTCAGTGELRGDRTEPCPECRGDRGRRAVAKRFQEQHPVTAAAIDAGLRNGLTPRDVLQACRIANPRGVPEDYQRRVRRQVLAYLAEVDQDFRRELERAAS